MTDKDPSYRELLEESYPGCIMKPPCVGDAVQGGHALLLFSTGTAFQRIPSAVDILSSNDPRATYIHYASDSDLPVEKWREPSARCAADIYGQASILERWDMEYEDSSNMVAIKQVIRRRVNESHGIDDSADPYRIHESEIKGNFTPEEPPATDD